MKRIVCMCAMMAAVMAAGQDGDFVEKISLTVGAIKVIDLPFVLQTFKASPPDVVQVENSTDRQLRLTGLKSGACDLIVNGGGLSKQYIVTVLDNVRKLFDRLRADLDGLPELELSINQNYIVIRGEISDVEHWKVLRQVLPLYEKMVQNLAVFRPKPESLVNLKKLLTDSGFEVSETAIPKEPGKIGFAYSADAVTVTGRVYTPSDIAAIQQVFATQEWLAPPGADNVDGKIRLVMKLSVEPTMIDVGAVYVGVSSDEVRKIGSENTFAMAGTFSSLVGLLRGGAGATHHAGIGAGLNPTMRFLANNGVSRFKAAGHLTFISNEGDKMASFHQGGTLSVRVQGVNSGDLKEIPYGLTMRVSGGLIGANKVKLNISLSRDDPPMANASGDYDQSQSSVETAVICGLDETIALAGMKQITEMTDKRGLPYLRNVPVLSWFVSQKDDQNTDMQLLILISPRLATHGAAIEIPPSAQTADTVTQAETTNKERMKAEAKKKPWWRRIF